MLTSLSWCLRGIGRGFPVLAGRSGVGSVSVVSTGAIVTRNVGSQQAAIDSA